MRFWFWCLIRLVPPLLHFQSKTWFYNEQWNHRQDGVAIGIIQISKKVIPDARMSGVGREAARPKSDLADVLMSGMVPNSPYLNDWPFPGFFTLFERNISHGRAGVVRTNQNLSQHPAKAAFLSFDLKHAGLVLGSSHPGPSSCLLDFWFPSRCRRRLSPKIWTQVLARGKFQASCFVQQMFCSDPQHLRKGFSWEGRAFPETEETPFPLPAHLRSSVLFENTEKNLTCGLWLQLKVPVAKVSQSLGWGACGKEGVGGRQI